MKRLFSLPAQRPLASCWLAIILVGAAGLIVTRGQNVPTPAGAVALDTSLVSESSGLARSRDRDNLFWTHNDSGDRPRLFAFTAQGRLQALLTVERAAAVDWEDMCTFARDGIGYTAVADVGDNRQSRRQVTIYVFKEPHVAPASRAGAQLPVSLTAQVEHEIVVRYPDGPLNCEALAYDPWRQEFLLASKEPIRSRIYSVPFDLARPRQEVTARLLATVLMPMVTGAAVSDDGQLMALCSYGPTCLLRRPTAVDWSQASDQLRRQATWQSKSDEELELLPGPPRRQGEAVCFDATGRELLLTSEGSPMLLFRSELPQR